MNADDYFEAVVANPEDDAPRFGYADALKRAGDPWGRFVELQLTRIRDHRLRNETADSWNNAGGEERDLFEREHAGSVRQIVKYTVPRRTLPTFRFVFEIHRGFVVRILCAPRMFLEYGDYLFKIAPLRGIDFNFPAPGGERLLDEVLASPLLQRLDYVGFDNWRCTPDEVERIFASPNLSRCLHLNLAMTAPTSAWPALARSPLARQLLRFDLDGGPARRVSGYEDVPSNGAFVGKWISEYMPTSDFGKEMEQEHGYFPWIHTKHNFATTWDLRYFLDKGVLPDRPAGSPVDYTRDPNDGDPEARVDHLPPVKRVYDDP